MNIFVIYLFLSHIIVSLKSFDQTKVYPIWFHVLVNTEDNASCVNKKLTTPRKRQSCETEPVCNGVAIDRTWVLTAAHCVLFRNIIKLDVSHGGDLEDGQIRIHYPISFVVINQDFTRTRAVEDDVGLIKLMHELPISRDQFPIINYYQILDRSKAMIFIVERKSSIMSEQNSVRIELRNHECLQAHDTSLHNINKAFCYEIQTNDRTLAQKFNGAPVIALDMHNTTHLIRYLIGIHIQSLYLKSHFIRIGRGLNIAWYYHWIKIAKFNRDAAHIPADKKFYCCDSETLNIYNTEPYERRSTAMIPVRDQSVCINNLIIYDK